MRACHFTSGHRETDSRIFHKECRSLAAAGVATTLVVPGAPTQVTDGVQVIGVEVASGSLWRRFSRVAPRVYRTVRAQEADLHHFHDPELLPFALLLKLAGRTLVYDAHDDLPKMTFNRDYIPVRIRAFVSWLLYHLERLCIRRFDGVVAATPQIGARIAGYHPRVLVLGNFPTLSELQPPPAPGIERRAVCYVGGVGVTRGIREMVLAVARSPFHLIVAGRFPDALRARLERLPEWTGVETTGYVGRDGVADVLNRSAAGLVLLHPTPSHLEVWPIKMFEYFAAGLPVVASDFPLWRELVEDNGCGFCVDPLDIDAIADRLNWIAEHPDEAREMGANGQRMVRERYNWERSESSLLEFYRSLAPTVTPRGAGR